MAKTTSDLVSKFQAIHADFVAKTTALFEEIETTADRNARTTVLQTIQGGLELPLGNGRPAPGAPWSPGFPSRAKSKAKAKGKGKPDRAGKPGPKPGFKRDRSRPSPAVVASIVKKVTAYLEKNPGATSLGMGEALGLSSAQLAYPLRKMRESGVAVMKGERRHAKYTLKS